MSPDPAQYQGNLFLGPKDSKLAQAAGRLCLFNDSDSHCLKFLGESHITDRCSVCCGFKTRMEKLREEHHQCILMEADLMLASEPP